MFYRKHLHYIYLCATFFREGCKDPFVNGNYRNSRRACLNQQKNKMTADLNACLRRQIPQSDLPTPALENGEFK